MRGSGALGAAAPDRWLQALGRDGVLPVRGQSRTVRLSGWLGVASYLLAVVGLSFGIAFGDRPDMPTLAAIPVVLGMLLVLLARAVTAGRAWPQRRVGARWLAAGIGCYAIGGIVFAALTTGSGSVGVERGESLVGHVTFLPGYACIAVFVLVDVPVRRRFGPGQILDALVVAGAAACAAGLLLLTPLVDAFPNRTWPELLLLVAYPLIASLLAIGVFAGAVAGGRAWSLQTCALIAGLTALAVGNVVIIRSYAVHGMSSTDPLGSSLLSVGLAGVAASACGQRRPPTRRGAADAGSQLTALAAFVPIVTLATTRLGPLTIVCFVTLGAVGLRLALSMREARNHAAEALRLSRTDELTGLPNRGAVVQRAIQADEADEPLCLLLADLDGFKHLNDTLGHPAGDTVLHELGARLRAGLPDDTLIARLGGDEFAVVTDAADAGAARAGAARLREIIARPIDVLGHSVTLNASVGIALREPRSAGGSELLRQADIAMYQAKAQRAGALIYHPDRDEFTADRLRLAEDLRRAIPKGQLHVWYQPQIDAQTRGIAGLEALVRWRHPVLGIVPPSEFIPVARQSGLMPALTQVVLDAVLADAVRLRSAGIATRLSFNVAPAELLDSALLDGLLSEVDRSGLPAGTLVLEVTEDSFLADPERAREAIAQISRHRIEVSVDDYGSGFSSLAYLRDLPVQELKMDRSFVTTVGTEARSRIIVASTVQLAHGLGLRAVAEGVEDEVAASTLQELGVDVLQGYHFARPMPFPDLTAWIAAWNANAGARQALASTD